MQWQGIVERHGEGVFRAAWRVLRDVQEAEDVAQDVLLEFYRGGRTAADGGLLPRMAVLRAVDRLRRRKPAADIDGVSLPSRDGDPLAEAIGNELAERLQAAVARLPARQAQAFCLRYLHGASYEEIAAALGVSRGAAGVAIHEARARLRVELGEQVREGKT